MSDIFFIFFILMRPVFDLYVDFEFLGLFNFNVIINFFLILICGISVIKNLNFIKENRFLLNFNKIFLIYLIVNLFSFFNSGNYFIFISDFGRLIVLLISFNYVSIYYRDEKKCLFLIKIIIFSSIIPILFGLHQIIFNAGNKGVLGFNRIYGTFVHPNVFASYLLIILFLILFILTNFKINNLERTFFSLLALLIVFSIYNTFTRIIWAALFIGIIVFIFLGKNKITKKIGYLFSVAFFLLILFPFFQQRIADPLGQGSSLVWRVDLWEKVFSEIGINNLFSGQGLGMFEYEIGVMAHNDYLRVYYESGLIALISYVFLLLYLLFNSVIREFRSKTIIDSNRYKIAACVVLFLLIIGFTDNILRSLGVMIYYFVAIAILFNFYDLSSPNFLKIDNNIVHN